MEKDQVGAYDQDIIDEKKQKAQIRQTNRQVKANNLKAVFGSGIGKISIIIAGVFILILGALGVRGLTGETQERNTAKVDVPRAPAPSHTLTEITPEERDRRARQAALEAQEAKDRGDSYLATFDPLVNSNRRNTIGDDYNFNQSNTNSEQETDSILTEQQYAQNDRRNNSGYSSSQEEDYKKRIAQEYLQAEAERDRYIQSVRSETLNTVKLTLDGKSGLGIATSLVYYTEPKESSNIANQGQNNNSVDSDFSVNDVSNNKAPTIKTGSFMYATLISEVNTDDGGEVLARIHGGDWDQAVIIGKIEQANDNIRLQFRTLAPSDDRPTMAINAVALRETDAKQGMATSINRHNLARYTALAVSSLLSGYGEAYKDNAGTSVITNGSTVTTTEDPSHKRVMGNVVGEFGRTMSQEVRRGFDRPTTYKTSANTGFVLFFLTDVE